MEKGAPRLRFVGRADGVSDLRGEKLNPWFVSRVLAGFSQDFVMLAPWVDADPPAYVLFTTDPRVCARSVDAALRENPYYDHARGLGQLGELRLFIVTDADPARAFMERCLECGQRAGTVKITALHAKPGWENWFTGGFVS